MFSFRGEKLHYFIRKAIADGRTVRHAVEQSRRAAEETAARALAEEREARVRAVLSALPRNVTKAITLAAVLPANCSVMFVRPSEYDGVIHHDFSAQTTQPQVSPDSLRGAAAWVFEELQMAGASPTLRYEYPLGADLDDWYPSMLDHLCICISVQ
ncbi:hypothetical protein BH11CYA1_BH11CYA1_35030 [soil metagenome]